MAKKTKKPTSAKEGKFLKKKHLILKRWGLIWSSPTLNPIFDTDFSQLSGDVHAVLETLYAMQVTRNRFQKKCPFFY